jgi:hypothetical protein
MARFVVLMIVQERKSEEFYLCALMISGWNTVMAAWNLNGALRGADDGPWEQEGGVLFMITGEQTRPRLRIMKTKAQRVLYPSSQGNDSFLILTLTLQYSLTLTFNVATLFWVTVASPFKHRAEVYLGTGREGKGKGREGRGCSIAQVHSLHFQVNTQWYLSYCLFSSTSVIINVLQAGVLIFICLYFFILLLFFFLILIFLQAYAVTYK